jgi:5-methylthioadenosine/S-adenosylhomocysteine deaminase
MIASGITTVQHLHGWLPGGLETVEAGAGEVIRAYEDIGMRVSYSFALRDQNRLVYQDDKEFTASLPAELQPTLQRDFARFGLNLAYYGPLFEYLHAKHHNKERVKVQLAPANLHWFSDAALEMLADYSARYEAPMHMHLVETPYQKEYACRRGGGTALDYIDRFGFLGPAGSTAEISYRRHRFPPAIIQHAVWVYLRFTLSYRDVEELLAERGSTSPMKPSGVGC